MKVGYKNSTEKYLIWHIEGGLGKNIAATSLLLSINEKYHDRKIIIVASYPEIFITNPNVFKVFAVGNTPYFYQDYIEDKDVLIFRHEAYFQNGHLLKQKHLINSWCDMFDLEYKNQTPVLVFNLIHKRMVNLWKRDKPILLIQTNGGPMDDNKIYSWTRDIPPLFAYQIVEKYKKDYHVIQICRNKEEVLPNVEESYYEQMSNYELFTLLASSEKRVLIDSCLQHAATALNLPSTVLWIGTSPKLFGYDIHSNLLAKPPLNKPKLINSYFFDYSFSGEVLECPYNDVTEIFDLEEIYDYINKI